MKYKAIFFDFDGVILDTLHAKGDAFALLYTSDKNDKLFSDIMTLHLVNGGMNRVEKIKLIHRTFFKEEISEELLNKKLADLKVTMHKSLSQCPPIDNYVLPLIAKLASSVPLWVVSAAPLDELSLLCDNLKISGHFKKILGSCKKTEVLKDLLEKENLKAEDTLFIGDAEEDFKAAKNNSLPFILKRNANNKTPFSESYQGASINSFNELDSHL